MSDTRTTLALPVDVARAFDSTITQTNITSDTFMGSGDDVDLIKSFIEDAEAEFQTKTTDDFLIASEGIAGDRTTYEVVTYDLSGHEMFKANWTGTTTRYRMTEVSTALAHGRILPFDTAAGDDLQIYRGLQGQSAVAGSTWEAIADEEGESWAITDYQTGRITFDPSLLFETAVTNRQGIGLNRGELRELRVAISYRYGGQAGSRGHVTETELDAALTAGQTGTVAVVDGATFPTDGNEIVVSIGDEYLSVIPDAGNNQMNVLERGIRGTTAAAHSSGDTIHYTPPGVRKAVAARAAMQVTASGRYQGWLPDEEDALDKGDLMDSFRSTWETTIQALS